MACGCPPEDDCPGAGNGACAVAASFRKAPQAMEPTCGDLDETGNVAVGPDGEPLCAVHEPIDPCAYRSGAAITAQKAVDMARRQLHVLGFRPYRVFLVWRRRDRRQVFQEFRRKELMPVAISPLIEVDRELRSVGLDQVGAIRLTRISPNQVSEFELRGQIQQGVELANDEEYFFEVVRQARFSGETPERARFNIASLPHYNASRFQFELDVATQDARRDPNGGDQTLKPTTPPRSRRLEVLRR